MNVKEQGPGGLLMLFASGACLYHLERILPRLREMQVEQAGVMAASLFAAGVAFLLLSLLRSAWMRNAAGFLLGSGVLAGLVVIHVHSLAKAHHSSEMELTYIKANMIKDGRNPYDPKETRRREDYSQRFSGLTPTDKPTVGKLDFTQPVGAALVLLPLRIFDSEQQVDPRYVELGLLLLTCLLIGTALGRNFFLLPLLMVLSVPTFLQAVLAGETGFAWLLLVTMAWTVAPKRLLAGVLMGLACATNVAAWFIAPFLVAITARENSVKAAAGQLALLLVVFAAVNGYWIHRDHQLWGTGVVHELVHPERGKSSVGLVYPERDKSSVGLVYLEQQKVLPALSKTAGAYWGVVGVVLALLLALVLFYPGALYALGPVLGLLPFWAFYHSPPRLFDFVPLLAMAGWASARIHPPGVRCASGAHSE